MAELCAKQPSPGDESYSGRLSRRYVFRAQQAAEKAIKAVMIERGIDFPYVHDLAHLLSVLEEAGEIIPEDIRAAETITNYSSAARYPNVGSPVSGQEHSEAVAIAEAVVHWAEGHL